MYHLCQTMHGFIFSTVMYIIPSNLTLMSALSGLSVFLKVGILGYFLVFQASAQERILPMLSTPCSLSHFSCSRILGLRKWTNKTSLPVQMLVFRAKPLAPSWLASLEASVSSSPNESVQYGTCKYVSVTNPRIRSGYIEAYTYESTTDRQL